MKNKLFLLAIAAILSLGTFTRSYAADVNTSTTAIANEQRLEQMKARLDEIKHMDESSLTREERKELRTEVKDMRKEAKAMSGGVYLSVGAIIIIILVLILIL